MFNYCDGFKPKFVGYKIAVIQINSITACYITLIL